MEKEQIEQLLPQLLGLKYWQWCKLAHCVEQYFSRSKNQLEIDDIDLLKQLFDFC